ncbi:CCA tRNA nucleotidyltransferase [Aurantiacibacter gangjinensis]|uniref:Polynucleotide adenylyltransferase n=1 Tax=Aurantiacibacter gangjinensis TaxID=502682 RepID=A0A0G9MRB3_9SPHN|nr:CCA tRNA nucleotidyltransferase [Aurantiacibacter gangjinensis]APE29179.1 tRNA nucleotidyltransferase [Aurantiacibacter gangjinensis]KLE33245.1 polynucleotide adenylyltransferase [Aurantiacibacter gangjinensis]
MASSLPTNNWTDRPDLALIIRALGADQMRWVGGAVRDTLLGVAVKDIDAATTLRPPAVMDALGEAGIKALPTGIDHGTVTAVLPAGPVEITTLRKDVATDGRRATVAFADDWQDDAARRDFTINALYVHPETLEISDYFGGLDDLHAGRVRFIGDARQRIREDHLRILRYYRFQARFGSELDAEAERACAELAPMLKGLSRERVAMELLAILALPHPHDALVRMHEAGVLDVILPEAGERGLESHAMLIATENRQGVAPAPLRRLAALLPGDPKTAGQVAARLRLSNNQRKHLERLAKGGGAPDGSPALVYHEGAAVAQDLLLLNNASIADIADFDPPAFPLKGGEIVARGVQAGPEVARILQAVERRWIAEGFPESGRVQRLLDDELRR